MAVEIDIECPLAGAALQHAGAHTVVITGGDDEQQQHSAWVTDLIFSRSDENFPETAAKPSFALHQQRETTQAHGTGSQFSAALAVQLTKGTRLYDAIVIAAAAARQALIASSGVLGTESGGTESGGMEPERSVYRNCIASPLPQSGDEWPLITDVGTYPRTDRFEPYNPGLYVLTESLDHLEMLLGMGVDTVQWRPAPGPDYKDQTRRALAMCRSQGSVSGSTTTGR